MSVPFSSFLSSASTECGITPTVPPGMPSAAFGRIAFSAVAASSSDASGYLKAADSKQATAICARQAAERRQFQNGHPSTSSFEGLEADPQSRDDTPQLRPKKEEMESLKAQRREAANAPPPRFIPAPDMTEAQRRAAFQEVAGKATHRYCERRAQEDCTSCASSRLVPSNFKEGSRKQKQ